MKTLTWQTVRGVGWTSRLIGWFGGGYYSHIDVVTEAGMLRGARSDWHGWIPPGYEDRPIGYESWERQTQWTIEVSDEEHAAYWKYSNAQLHKPYDKRGLVDTFVRGRDWRDNDKWWCSEEVAWNGEVAGLWEIPQHVLSVEPGDCVFLFIGRRARRQEFINGLAVSQL
jgi:hypothetical protein